MTVTAKEALLVRLYGTQFYNIIVTTLRQLSVERDHDSLQRSFMEIFEASVPELLGDLPLLLRYFFLVDTVENGPSPEIEMLLTRRLGKDAVGHLRMAASAYTDTLATDAGFRASIAEETLDTILTNGRK